MLASSSGDEQSINKLFIRFLILAIFIVCIVLGSVMIGAIFYRSKNEKDEPKQVKGHTVLEIIWTLVPFLILILFFYFTVKAMKDIGKPIKKGQLPDIVIVAHQWWWEFQLPKYKIVTANELHIPAGKQMLMRIESADVIHDWWVPSLGRKIDAIPGYINYSWINADSTGDYQGTCSEYCGTQHAWMRILVVAQSDSDFENWVHEQQKMPVQPVDTVAISGYNLYKTKTCINCHSIAGISSAVHIGPDLSHIASRKTLLSNMEPNTEENLAAWLKDPQKIKEGAHMPNFMLSTQELHEIITYLENLK